MSASNYLEDELLDHVLGGGGANAYTAPASVYLSLHTADPTDAGTGAEVGTGVNYIRKALSFGTASSGSITTDAAVTFDPCQTTDWGTITHIGIWDAESNGNMLFHGAVTSSKLIEVGDTFQVSTGNLTITLD